MKKTRTKGPLTIYEVDDTYSFKNGQSTLPLYKETAIRIIDYLDMEYITLTKDQILFLLNEFEEHQKEYNDSMEGWLRSKL